MADIDSDQLQLENDSELVQSPETQNEASAQLPKSTETAFEPGLQNLAQLSEVIEALESTARVASETIENLKEFADENGPKLAATIEATARLGAENVDYFAGRVRDNFSQAKAAVESSVAASETIENLKEFAEENGPKLAAAIETTVRLGVESVDYFAGKVREDFSQAKVAVESSVYQGMLMVEHALDQTKEAMSACLGDLVGIAEEINIRPRLGGLDVVLAGNVNAAVFKAAQALKNDSNALENPELQAELLAAGLGDVALYAARSSEAVRSALIGIPDQAIEAGSSGQLLLEDVGVSFSYSGDFQGATANVQVDGEMFEFTPDDASANAKISYQDNRLKVSQMSLESDSGEILDLSGVATVNLDQESGTTTVSGEGLPVDIGIVKIAKKADESLEISGENVLGSEVDFIASNSGGEIDVSISEIEGDGRDGILSISKTSEETKVEMSKLAANFTELLDGVLVDGVVPALRVISELERGGVESLANEEVRESLERAGVDSELISIAQIAPDAFLDLGAAIPIKAREFISQNKIDLSKLEVESLNARLSKSGMRLDAEVDGLPLVGIAEGVIGDGSIEVRSHNGQTEATIKEAVVTNLASGETSDIGGKIAITRAEELTEVVATNVLDEASIVADFYEGGLGVGANVATEGGELNATYDGRLAAFKLEREGVDASLSGTAVVSEEKTLVSVNTENYSLDDVRYVAELREDPKLVQVLKFGRVMGLVGPEEEKAELTGNLVEDVLTTARGLAPEGHDIEASVSLDDFEVAQGAKVRNAEIRLDADLNFTQYGNESELQVSDIEGFVTTPDGETKVDLSLPESMKFRSVGDGAIVMSGNDLPAGLSEIAISSADGGLQFEGENFGATYNRDEIKFFAVDVGEDGTRLDANYKDGNMTVEMFGIGREEGSIVFSLAADGSTEVEIRDVDSGIAQLYIQEALKDVVIPGVRLGDVMREQAPPEAASLLSKARDRKIDKSQREGAYSQAQDILEETLDKDKVARKAGASETLVNLVDTLDLEAGLADFSRLVPEIVKTCCDWDRISAKGLVINKLIAAYIPEAENGAPASMEVDVSLSGVKLEALAGDVGGLGTVLSKVVKAPTSTLSWASDKLVGAVDGNVVTDNIVGNVGRALGSISNLVTNAQSVILSPVSDTEFDLEFKLSAIRNAEGEMVVTRNDSSVKS